MRPPARPRRTGPREGDQSAREVPRHPEGPGAGWADASADGGRSAPAAQTVDAVEVDSGAEEAAAAVGTSSGTTAARPGTAEEGRGESRSPETPGRELAAPRTDERRRSILAALGSRRPQVAPNDEPEPPRRGPRANNEPRADSAARPEADPGAGSAEQPPAAIPTPRPDPRSVVSGGLTERLARREAVARRARLGRLALVIAGLAAVAAVVWALFFSPLLALDEGQISVASDSPYVDAAQVHEAAAAEAGTPLPRLSIGDLAGHLASQPGVLSADVARDWPRGLAITITPREPVAVASGPSGTALVDAEGVVVARVDGLPEGGDGDLPRLDMPLAPLEQTEAYERMDAALTVLGVLPAALRTQVATAAAASPGSVTLTLDNGATVRWGSVEDAELKAAVLSVLVAEEPGTVYDVSVPDRPTVS